MKLLSRIFLPAIVLWLVFVLPPATLTALLRDQPFYTHWLGSLWLIPLPLLLAISVFRFRSRAYRWWIFQYLGVTSIAFSAALLGALLSLFIGNLTAGLCALIAFAVFYALGLRAAHRIDTVPLTIRSARLAKPLRIVQISDIHIGSRPAAFLKKVIQQVESQHPDIVAVTGDLLDENVAASDLMPLNQLDCPVVYCSGNHERYVDYQRALQAVAAQGVTVLNDDCVFINGIHIVGIADREKRSEAAVALDRLCHDHSAMDDRFKLLLYHQPDLWETAIEKGFELSLSGHTHNGQIWPFGWLVRTRYKHVAGHYRNGSSHLFVSQGTGTWGPTLRFGTRCEMTVIDLQPA